MDPNQLVGLVCIGGILVGVIPAAIVIDRWMKKQKAQTEQEDLAWRNAWISGFEDTERLYNIGSISHGEFQARINDLNLEWKERYGRDISPLVGLIAIDMLLD